MESMAMSGLANPQFWRGKRVFLTGHTGFKGTWLSLILHHLGAKVSGYALAPLAGPSLQAIMQPAHEVASTLGDINDAPALAAAMSSADPEIILHLAAQPLVRQSYATPADTFRTNVMGTVHLLEAARALSSLRVVLIVTTDKVYRNENLGHAFVEDDPLGGHDPYSASKAACEIAVESWRKCFFQPRGVALASARAGNVIGGGDFAPGRIIPDIFRSFERGEPVVLRYPQATRPWQHVLDCLNGYLLYAAHLYAGTDVPSALNFGPDSAPLAVAEVVAAMQAALGAQHGWTHEPGAGLQTEAVALALDTHRARSALGWRDRLTPPHTISQTAQWYGALARGEEMRAWTQAEIAAYYSL